MCGNPTQVYVNPTQVCVNPTQVCVNPTQVYVNPTQVCVDPTLVCVNPTQVCVNPTQVYVNPTPRCLLLVGATAADGSHVVVGGLVDGGFTGLGAFGRHTRLLGVRPRLLALAARPPGTGIG